MSKRTIINCTVCRSFLHKKHPNKSDGQDDNGLLQKAISPPFSEGIKGFNKRMKSNEEMQITVK